MARWIGSLLAIVTCLSGCGSGGIANPPDGRIRALNMVSSRATVSFLRVERAEGSLTYKQSTGFIVVDSDTYNFNIEVTAPGATDPTRVASLSRTIEVDRDYTFVITEPTPNNFVVTSFERDVAAAPAGQTAVDLLHLASALGSVDIFIEPPGTPLAGAQAFAQAISPSNTVLEGAIPAGDYVISATPPADPNTILFASTTVTLADGDRVFATLADSVGTITSNVSVVLNSNDGNTNQEVFAAGATAEIRFLNASSQAGALDLVIDDNFTTPLHPAVASETVSNYAGLASGTRNIKVTPAGSMNAELDQDTDIPTALRTTLLVGGDLGAIVGAQEVDNLRVLPGTAKLRLASGAATEGPVNVYVVPTGTDISSATPVAANFQVGFSPYLQFLPGDYDIVVTETGSTNIIGTVTVTLNGSGIYGAVVVDDPTVRVRLVLIDDFP